ncbi:fimbrial protein [Salmonella enterica subsp. enterica serovar Thompson]|nr:fimbrial protein [Salmonella enterica subsp. enterica serovar Thompson]EBV8143428.1 fimbrial protein [Salmonella enterica subsp. enterica serovar Thompson]EDY1281271.1 fimbrial protein [Salmonella enterica subsp. enterica serovar Thompson]EED9491877.1 fimbrial protein [Salmonella enterica subsp. enterica serovar Thompson]EIQ4461845.1 fimbrial protein [Salmonella enterica]
MFRILILLLVWGGGYFTVFPASAATGCTFADGSEMKITVPQMALPSDTPDGTLLYTSPKITKRIVCESVATRDYITLNTTADFDRFLNMRNGIRFTLYVDGIAFDHSMIQHLGYTSPDGSGHYKFIKDVSVSYDIRVDSSRGKIPVSGTMLSGGFQSVFVILHQDYSLPRGIISLYTPNITYIPCTMKVSVSPETIDFGAVKSSDLEKGVKLQKSFSTLIKKSKSCLSGVTAPFGINMYFEPTNPVINADGSLKLNDGVGLSITDSAGKDIAFNQAQKIDDVKVDSILKNDFRASLHKVSGQDIKTGTFSADVVVRLSYY